MKKSLGATFTDEYGMCLARALFMCSEHSPVAMRLMSDIKKLFDPNNILNPGKMALEC